MKIARIQDQPNGGFHLEYDNTQGRKNRMRLDALTYEQAMREARVFLDINADNRDTDNLVWDLE